MTVKTVNLSLGLMLAFVSMGQICGAKIEDSKSMRIVTFRPKKVWTDWYESPKVITNGLIATKDVTLCFRYMTFINKDPMVLIETAQLKIMFHYTYGYLIIRQWNATTSNDEYRRLIKPCKPYKPGHWFSLCIKVKLVGKTQEITYYQGGEKCFQTQFADGNFEWLYFKKRMTHFEDLLG